MFFKTLFLLLKIFCVDLAPDEIKRHIVSGNSA